MDPAPNGRCSRCGRQSDGATTEELGGWVVETGGVLICSECSKRVDQAAESPKSAGVKGKSGRT
jgi:DNA-directed RNA polymerase subunit RPC12/RpoP